MVLTGAIGTQQLTLNLKPSSLNLMFGTTDVLTYDRSGRLWMAVFGGRSYRRGLNGRVLAKWRDAEGTLHREPLSSDSAQTLIDRCAGLVRQVAGQIDAGVISWNTVSPDEAMRCALATAADFDATAAARDEAAFARVYDPVGILPPDQYMAVVLQATAGCSFNTCTFCDFYRGRRFLIKSPETFRAHARAVRAFLGDSITIRRSIFLGEANALAVPFARLAELMQVARDEFGNWPVHAFQDGFSGQRKSAEEYRHLAELGLRRVSIGLESGHDPLLEFVRKPSSAADVAASVAALKAAGVAVSLIVLVGLGGDRFAERHVADTVALLNRLPLGVGDIVYLSDLVEHPDTSYPALAREAGIRALDSAELYAQREAILSGLHYGASGPKVARYDIHEFVY